MHFASDNAVGAAPEILAALAAADAGAVASYGGDALTARVEARLAAVFERDVAVALVATGTAANALALACHCPPWGAVLCHGESHLATDECGAPEAFTAGAKLVGLDGAHAKIAPQTLTEALARMPAGVQHHVQPAVLGLTQATEAGTVYTPGETAALAAIAHARGLKVHMDGARLANALAALGASPAEATWQAGVDVLSLGATKNGALAVEAVVLFDPGKREELIFRRKRSGHLLSKHRFLAAQMLAYLEADLWLDLAAHANAMAARLADGLVGAGLRLAAPVQANAVFPVLPRALAERLRGEGAVFYDWAARAMMRDVALREGETIARLVTSWASRAEEVDRFVALARDNLYMPNR